MTTTGQTGSRMCEPEEEGDWRAANQDGWRLSCVYAEVCDASSIRLDRRVRCRDGRILRRRCGLDRRRLGAPLIAIQARCLRLAVVSRGNRD